MADGKDSLGIAGEKGEPIFLRKHLSSELVCVQCGHRFLAFSLDSDDHLCPGCLADYHRMVAEE